MHETLDVNLLRFILFNCEVILTVKVIFKIEICVCFLKKCMAITEKKDKTFTFFHMLKNHTNYPAMNKQCITRQQNKLTHSRKKGWVDRYRGGCQQNRKQF